MKKIFFALVACLALCACSQKDDWKIAMQSYTFHNFTLLETFDKCQELGIKYIEVYPGHRIGGKWGNEVFSPTIDAAAQEELRQLAADKGLKMVAIGVFTSDNPEEWEQLFSFAKAMDMEYVTCEPPLELWDKIEALAEEYQMPVAVHNHPQPSTYWNPDNLLKAIDGRSKLLGSCADVGHWNRQGLDHLECLRKLDGRLVSFHFKDIIAKPEDGSEQHDCIWGEGILDVPAMLSILREQKFQGYLAIEYEYNWDNSVPDIKQCLENLKGQ